MANIILPLLTSILYAGSTVDINSFDDADSYRKLVLFKETDIIETPLDISNATYYVLQDDKMPYSALDLPIDLAISLKRSSSYIKINALKSLDYHRVSVLFVAEYKKSERSVKEGAELLPLWQEKVPKGHTHYADKAYYGGKFIALAQFESSVTGDVQVIRRKLTEIMGVSGKITKDTHDLWRHALETVRADPEVRGSLWLSRFDTTTSRLRLPSDAGSVNTFLKYLADLSSYVLPLKTADVPLSVSLRPLHDLDKHYPEVEMNLETAKYLQQADDSWEDLNHAIDLVKSAMAELTYSDLDILYEYEDFYAMLRKLTQVFWGLDFRSASIYQKINTSSYDAAFEKLHSGLYKGADTYYISALKFYEDKNPKCSNGFLKPTKGTLRVQANEMDKKELVEGGLEECLQECLKDGRCRAAGFDGKNKHLCSIYYRSTVTAKIEAPAETSSETTIHDRDCKFIGL